MKPKVQPVGLTSRLKRIDWGPVVRSAPSFWLPRVLLSQKAGAAPPDATPYLKTSIDWSALPYLILALLVLGPLLLPGFVLTMDMVFTPQLRWPQQLDNTYVFYAFLHILNLLLPADVIQKCLLLGILLLSGIGMHRLIMHLLPRTTPWPQWLAGGFYMVNPFVYDRLMSGQYGVLLGYALLPWFVRPLLLFVSTPGPRQAVRLGIGITVMSIVSIHSLGFVAIFVLSALIVYGRDRLQLRKLTAYGSLTAMIFLAASCYWLIPLVLGNGKIATSLATFSGSERQAFATVDANGFGSFGSVLGLQGFWQETRNLFMLPIDVFAGWSLAQLMVWALIVYGAIAAWQRRRREAAFFGLAALVGAVLATGFGNDWLASHLPFFAGYREPQKFVAVVACGYAFFIGWASKRLLARPKQWLWIGGIALLLVAYTPTMWWGMGGQLRATDYPTGWYDIRKRLGDTEGSRALFLPWHLYMSYSFSDERIIASPASAFFAAPIIASDDPELKGVAPQTPDTTRQRVQTQLLPALQAHQDISEQLIGLGVRYVLLAKEYDYRTYETDLQTQPHIKRLQDTTSLALYQVER